MPHFWPVAFWDKGWIEWCVMLWPSFLPEWIGLLYLHLIRLWSQKEFLRFFAGSIDFTRLLIVVIS